MKYLLIFLLFGSLLALGGQPNKLTNGYIDIPELTLPQNIEFDGEHFYIPDQFEKAIFQINLQGKIIGKISKINNKIFSPTAVLYIFPFLYLTDYQNNALYRLKKENYYNFLNGEKIPVKLSGPTAISSDAYGDIYIIEKNRARIAKLSGNEEADYIANSKVVINNKLKTPRSLVLNSTSQIFVAEANGTNLNVFNKDGIFMETITGNFQDIRGLAIDQKDQLYVADYFAQNIQVFQNSVLIKTIDQIDQTKIYPLAITIHNNKLYILDDTKRVYEINIP